MCYMCIYQVATVESTSIRQQERKGDAALLFAIGDHFFLGLPRERKVWASPSRAADWLTQRLLP